MCDGGRAAVAKPKAEMTQEELAKLEEEQFNTGPMQVLVKAIKNNNQVLITYAVTRSYDLSDWFDRERTDYLVFVSFTFCRVLDVACFTLRTIGRR